MWQDCSLTAVQRKTACVEQSWWPEFKVFGSTPWCSGVCSYGTSSSEGWRKKNVVKSTVSLNLIDEFTSLFSPKVIVAGLPRKAFPRKQAFVDISVFLWLRKQQPRFAQGQPKGYFQMKEIDINERRRKLNANMRQYVLFRGNMDQHCSLSAVQRKTAFLESWWPEFNMFGSMPLCWFPKETPLWASALEQAFATWTAVWPLPPRQGATFCLDHLFLGGAVWSHGLLRQIIAAW